jgi:hypothetical protein
MIKRPIRKRGANCEYEQTHHLPRSHAHRLDCEFVPAHVEQVLEAGTQQVNNQSVVKTLLSEIVCPRDTSWYYKGSVMRLTPHCGESNESVNTTTSQYAIRPVLVAKLRRICLSRLL